MHENDETIKQKRCIPPSHTTTLHFILLHRYSNHKENVTSGQASNWIKIARLHTRPEQSTAQNKQKKQTKP